MKTETSLPAYRMALLALAFGLPIIFTACNTTGNQNNSEPVENNEPAEQRNSGDMMRDTTRRDTVNDGGYIDQGGALDPDLHDSIK